MHDGMPQVVLVLLLGAAVLAIGAIVGGIALLRWWLA